jgi:hypothetical protein
MPNDPVCFVAFGVEAMHDLAGYEVWTLNDWYYWPHLRGLEPDRIYQIHEDVALLDAFVQNGFAGRMHDWRRHYNESGAEVVVLRPLNGVSRQRLFDRPRAVAEFGEDFFVSTLSFMFAEAIWEGRREILLQGVVMGLSTEYREQVPGTLHNIAEARRRGIEVKSAYEAVWHGAMKKMGADGTLQVQPRRMYGAA